VDADELLGAAYKECHSNDYSSTTRKKLDRLENNKHWINGIYAFGLLVLGILLKFFGMDSLQHIRDLHLHFRVPFPWHC